MLCTAFLSACDSSTSDIMEIDRALNNEPDNHNYDSYSGRAAEAHYLQNALVWLDLNDNKLVDEDEPATRTAEEGRFDLDISKINDERRDSLQPALDPRNYPLMLIAIPGETLRELKVGSETRLAPVDEGFFLMAPAGTNFISPLSTLLKIQRDYSFASTNRQDPVDVEQKLSVAHNTVRSNTGAYDNLLLDFIKTENEKMAVYSAVVAKFIEKNIPADIDERLISGNIGSISESLTRQVGRLVLSRIKGLWSQADAVARVSDAMDYSRVNADTDITYPIVPLDFDDPMLLVGETTYKKHTLVDGEVFEELGGYITDANISSEMQYIYNENADLLSIIVDGYKEFNALIYGGYAPYSFLLGTELFQFWGRDQIADQIFSYGLDGDRFKRIELDSRHVLDFNAFMPGALAKEQMLDNPDAYVLDGVPDNSVIFSLLNTASGPDSATGEGALGDYSLKYAYLPAGKLETIEKLVDGEVVTRWKYTHDYVKTTRGGEYNVLVRIDEYSLDSGMEELTRSTELYYTLADVFGEPVRQVSQIYIYHPARETETRNLIWTLEYYNPITIARTRRIDLPSGLSEADPADLATARAALADHPERELEGRIRQARLSRASNDGFKPDTFGASTFLVHKYDYDQLSNFIFSLEK